MFIEPHVIRLLLTDRQKLIRARKSKSKWSERHKAAGLCSSCTNKTSPGLTRCRECRKKAWKRRVCSFCGRMLASPISPGLRTHGPCRMRWMRLRARVIWNSSERSPAYIAGHRRAALAYQERHRRRGLCAVCPRRTIMSRCRLHRRAYGTA